MGTDEPYYQIVNRCYKLGSQLDMWVASHNFDAIGDKKDQNGRGSSQKGSNDNKNKGSNLPSRPDHSRIELEKTNKLFAQMTIQELRLYEENLPINKRISDRCIREGRGHS